MLDHVLTGIGAIAALAFVAAQVWIVVVAFRRHIAWGLGVLLVPLVSLVFVGIAWRETWRPLLLSVVALTVAVAAYFMGPGAPVAKMMAAFWSEASALHAARSSAAEAPQLTVEEKLATLKAREQELLARKTQLPAGDHAAAAALAWDIQQYNLELQPVVAAYHKEHPQQLTAKASTPTAASASAAH